MTNAKLDNTTLIVLAALTLLALFLAYAYYVEPTVFEPVQGAVHEYMTDPIGARGRFFP